MKYAGLFIPLLLFLSPFSAAPQGTRGLDRRIRRLSITQPSIPILGFGVFALKSPQKNLEIDVSGESGKKEAAVSPGSYELAGGTYEISAKLSGDEDWAWKGRAEISERQTVSFQLPAEAAQYSPAHRAKVAQERVDALEAERDASLPKARLPKTLAAIGWWTGGISTVATGALYWIGESPVKAFGGATTITAASSARSRVELCNDLFIPCASLGGAGLCLGAVSSLLAGKPDRIQKQVDSGLAHLKALQSQEEPEPLIIHADGSSSYPLDWQIKQAESVSEALQRDYSASLARRKSAFTLARIGFWTGGLSALATGAIYLVGRMSVSAFGQATTIADASAARTRVELCNDLFIPCASLAGAGLTLEGLSAAFAPRPARIESQVQRSIDRLNELEAQQGAEGGAR